MKSYQSVSEAFEGLPELDVGESSGSVENHVAANHRKPTVERFSAMDQGCGQESVPENLRTKKNSQQRLDGDRPAPTMLTLPDDFVHPYKPRIPTVREMARLQTFDDDFVFTGPRRTGGSHRQESVCQYQQVGNAVPVKLAESLADVVNDQIDS